MDHPYGARPPANELARISAKSIIDPAGAEPHSNLKLASYAGALIHDVPASPGLITFRVVTLTGETLDFVATAEDARQLGETLFAAAAAVPKRAKR